MLSNNYHTIFEKIILGLFSGLIMIYINTYYHFSVSQIDSFLKITFEFNIFFWSLFPVSFEKCFTNLISVNLGQSQNIYYYFQNVLYLV